MAGFVWIRSRQSGVPGPIMRTWVSKYVAIDIVIMISVDADHAVVGDEVV